MCYSKNFAGCSTKTEPLYKQSCFLLRIIEKNQPATGINITYNILSFRKPAAIAIVLTGGNCFDQKFSNNIFYFSM